MVFCPADLHAKCKTPNAAVALGVCWEPVAEAIPLIYRSGATRTVALHVASSARAAITTDPPE